jgi:hypothetical protein
MNPNPATPGPLHGLHGTARRGVRARLEPVLWVSAVVLVALAMVRVLAPAGSWAPSAEGAAVVSQSGGLTVMTTEALNEDLLVVLDSRNEELFVYRTELKGGVQLLQRYQVPQLFVDARARSTGGP